MQSRTWSPTNAKCANNKPLEQKLIGPTRSHIPTNNPPKQFRKRSFEQRDRNSRVREQEYEREREQWWFFLEVGGDVGWRDKWGGPHGDHNPPGCAWGSWRAQVGCAHLVHLPLILFALEILKYSEKIILNFQSILRNFIFRSFLIAREIQKIDKTWHFILFN